MKLQHVLTSCLLGALATTSQAAFMNPDFEDTSGTFPTGWDTAAGTVTQVAGLDGTATAAALDIGAALEQDFVDGLGGETGFTRFELNFVMSLAEVTDLNRVRIRGDRDSGTTNVITLRLNANGFQKFSAGFGWNNSIPAANFPAGVVEANTEYYAKIIVDELDGTDPDLEYQLGISTDGVNYVYSNPLGSYHSVKPEDAPIEYIRLEAGNNAAATFDEFSIVEIPEPGTLTLLVLSGFLTALRRRSSI